MQEPRILNFLYRVLEKLEKADPTLAGTLRSSLQDQYILTFDEAFFVHVKEKRHQKEVALQHDIYQLGDNRLVAVNGEVIETSNQPVHLALLVIADPYHLSNLIKILENAKELHKKARHFITIAICGEKTEFIFNREPTDKPDFLATLKQKIEFVRKMQSDGSRSREDAYKLHQTAKDIFSTFKPFEKTQFGLLGHQMPQGEFPDQAEYPSRIQSAFEEACEQHHLNFLDVTFFGFIDKDGYHQQDFFRNLSISMKQYMSPESRFFEVRSTDQILGTMASSLPTDYFSVQARSDDGRMIQSTLH